MRYDRLLRGQDCSDRGLELGVRRGDLGVALAVLQLGNNRSFGALVVLVLGGHVLVGRPYFFLVIVVAVQAALGLEYLRTGLRKNGAGRKRRRRDQNRNHHSHAGLPVIDRGVTRITGSGRRSARRRRSRSPS